MEIFLLKIKLWFLSKINTSIGKFSFENWSLLNLNFELIFFKLNEYSFNGCLTGKPKGVWMNIFGLIKFLFDSAVIDISIFFDPLNTSVEILLISVKFISLDGRVDLIFSIVWKNGVYSPSPSGSSRIRFAFPDFPSPA